MKLYIYKIAFVAALGGLLFGFDTAVISGVIEFIEKPHVFDLNEISKGWTVSSIIIGCMVGCVFAGKIGDAIGRKKSLMISASLFFISALGCAFANSLSTFVIFRLIGGLGVGSASILSPVYITEIAPSDQRGRLVSLNQLTIVIGILMAYISNFFLSGIGENNWRWMIGIMAIPSILFLVLLAIVPESPRWLILKSKNNEALKILGKVFNQDAQKEFDAIRSNLQTNTNTAGIKEFFSSKLGRVIAVVFSLAIFQQITGINAIIYYAPAIFETSGIETDSALLKTTLIGLVNFAFTFIAIFLVDKLGRKPLMQIGLTGMAISLIIVFVSFNLFNNSTALMTIGILGYIASFASSIGPVMWVLITEMLPTRFRSIGVSLSILLLWAANFVMSSGFPWLLSKIGGYVFLIFFILCVVMMIFVRIFVTETKNKSLEEIENLIYH